MTTFSLKRLAATNFRAVTDTIEIEFDEAPGLYFVAGVNEVEPRLGSNGASKSTLFVDALSWVFSGRTSRSNRPGADVENWTSSGSTGVICEFAIDDELHCVERWRNPSRLLLDDIKVEQKVIDDLLPLNDMALRRTLLIDQFAQLFLSMRPEDKSRIFSDTLNLEMWLRASETAGKLLEASLREVAKHENDAAASRGAINEARDQLEIVNNRIKEFETNRKAELALLISSRQDIAKEVEKTETELNKARAALAKVGQTDLKILSNDKKVEERGLIASISTGKAKLESLANHMATLTGSLAKYKNTSVCPECGQSVDEAHIKQKRQEIEQQIKEYDQSYSELFEVAKPLPTKLLVLQMEISRLEEDLSKFNAAQNEVSVQAERNLASLRQLHSMDEQIKKLQDQENPFTGHIEKLEERLKELRATVKKTQDALKSLNAEAEIYRFWQRGYREIRLEQIDTTLVELEMAANRHAQALGLEGWEIQFDTERETKSGTISHAFSVFLFPPGQAEPISWESYSGGESQRWQHAVTFGLAEVLLARAGIESDFEVVDEPTAHLSPEGIEDLLACLKDRALELNRRIYLIDHHALDRGAFDGIWTVTKTKSGVSLERGH